MSTIAVPDKWVASLDEKKFARVARFELHYRVGSAQYAPLPLGGAVSCGDDGLVTAPTLAAVPLTVREFLEHAYNVGNEHFLADTASDGSHPKSADLKIVLLDNLDKTLGEASKKLHRGEALRLTEDLGIVEQVTESSNVLAQTVRSLGSHVVSITSVEQRSRNDYESIMCQQMREVSAAWKEVNADREKITIDLVEAAQQKTRAEEESKRLELERQLAEEKTFMDSPMGEKLGTMLITGLVPKLLTFVDSALTTASAGLEKRRLKATAELTKYKRELEAELATGDRRGDRAEQAPT